MARKRKRRLRTGFTTGTAAAASVKGALTLALRGETPEKIAVTLPSGQTLNVKAHRYDGAEGSFICSVIKDAGDDPDVTNRAEIGARVRLLPGRFRVVFKAGEGVGTVTKPGLPIEVGEAAINPVPRMMIENAAKEALEEAAHSAGVEAEIFVTNGEALARRTLNPRLGIVGGLSILGTTGIVRPLSHEAYKETIVSALDVARAGGSSVVLSTGGKSEKFARRVLAEFPEECFVQMADFLGFALAEAAKRRFETAFLSVFIGKAVKMALGVPCTHANRVNMDLTPLVEIAENLRLSGLAGRVAAANTARHALDIIEESGHSEKILRELGSAAVARASEFAGSSLKLGFMLFDYSGIAKCYIEPGES